MLHASCCSSSSSSSPATAVNCYCPTGPTAHCAGQNAGPKQPQHKHRNQQKQGTTQQPQRAAYVKDPRQHIAMAELSPCCTGCLLIRGTDTRGITTDYNRGETHQRGWAGTAPGTCCSAVLMRGSFTACPGQLAAVLAYATANARLPSAHSYCCCPLLLGRR
jgi:hypothetical protein